MSLKKSLKNIKGFLKKRYKGNLAAILVFGSAVTNHYIEGKSDIDTIILLKEQKGLDLKKESKFLIDYFVKLLYKKCFF